MKLNTIFEEFKTNTNTLLMYYREASIEDIEQMHHVRISVRENKLSNPDRITQKDYETFLTERGKGWVCIVEFKVVGFCVIDLVDKNIWALFVLPEFKGKGIGNHLHQQMLDWYFAKHSTPLWLSTEKGTKAESFYRHRGWKDAGLYGKGEIKFEMHEADWKRQLS